MTSAENSLSFPFVDLKKQYAQIKDEIGSAVQRVLETQQFILGEEVAAFEAEIARLVGCRYAIACASGSDALLLALMSLDVGINDEVITTPFTFVSTAATIALLKARPIFVDIEPTTYNLDWQKVQSAITTRTKAILPVHLFGLPAEMNAIMRVAADRNIPVIEDAAQSIGARYNETAVGNIGACGCFSFFPTKNLGGAGDGGIVTTSDPRIAEHVALLRQHGSRRKYHYDILGINSRLDSIQAAILRVKLSHLSDWTAARYRNAARYRQLITQTGLDHVIKVPRVPPPATHVYNQFTIRAPQRDQLREHLKLAGIPTEVYYPLPLHLQLAFGYLGHRAGDYPESEFASQQVLSLPIFPELHEEQQELVVREIAEFYM